MGKQTHKNHGLDVEMLRGLYEKQLLSDAEIGRLYGLSDAGVSYLRRRHGIQTLSARNRRAQQAVRRGLRDIRSVERAEFEKLYRNHGERALARMFGCSKILIRRKREEWGIAALGKEQRLQGRMPEVLTVAQREVLYGSLLGDGGLSLNRSETAARYAEFHSIDQVAYLRWKHDVLEPFSGKVTPSDKMLVDGRIAVGRVFRTCFHSLFVPYHQLFYEEGVRHLPADFEEELTPLALAVWYMDDGHLADRTADGVPTIFSAFGLPDIVRAVEHLNAKWCLDAQPVTREDGTVIWLNNKDRFTGLVYDHMHPSMRYKVPLSLRRHAVESVCGFKHLSDILKRAAGVDWASLAEGELREWEERLFRYWRGVGFSMPYADAEARDKQVGEVIRSGAPLEPVVPTGHTQGASLCLTYCHHFWKAHRKGRRSPWQVFHDDDKLRKAIRGCIRYRGGISEAKLRAELQTFGGVHNFRASVAKAVVDRWCAPGGTVLDPCAGWGGRLLGTLCSQRAVHYEGVDASLATVRGLRRFGHKLEENEQVRATCAVSHAAFEDWEPTGRFDLVFTSPPYFDAEWYSNDSGQSAVRYATYSEWLESFLRVLVEKSWALLKPGGRLALNVADAGSYPIAEDLRAMVEAHCGLETTLRMALASVYGGETRYEPVFVSQAKRG